MPVTNFFWDGDNLLQEYDDAGVTTAQYSTEPGSFGNVSSQLRNGQSRYFHHDPLGSTTEVTDASGEVTDTRRYKAFGEIVEQSGSTTFPFQYVGRNGYYYDPERGTTYVRRRDFDPAAGRWCSQDPIPLSFNLYLYADNSPLTHRDPSGLQAGPTVKPRVKAFYPACCTWCRDCQESTWTQIMGCFIWNEGTYEECRGPQLVACPVILDANGDPVLHLDGSLYTEKRSCCEARKPSSYNLYCTRFKAKYWAMKDCSPWDTECERELAKWVVHAGEAKGTEGYLNCGAWCERCIVGTETGVLHPLDIPRAHLKKICIEMFCDASFDGSRGPQ